MSEETADAGQVTVCLNHMDVATDYELSKRILGRVYSGRLISNPAFFLWNLNLADELAWEQN